MFIMFGNEKCKEIIENICPYCKEHLIMNKRSFANHIRWCKENPKYEQIKNSTLTKLYLYRLHNPTSFEYNCHCVVCEKTYTVYTTPNKYKNGEYNKTCSDICAKKLTALKTDKKYKNIKISKAFSLKSKISDWSLNNEKECLYCKKIFKINKQKQKFCSKECSRKYRREKEIENKEEKEIYKSQAKFRFSLKDFPKEFNFSLIQENGWYKATNHGNNLNGVSRDHMFSIDEGYKQNVDPYLISHPANCKLMVHTENFKKNTKCSITLEELKERVEHWNRKYGIYKNLISYEKLERFNNL